MASVFEALMLICFGISWPTNAYNSYKARTAVGTSWQFLLLITVGYLFGIAAKFCAGPLTWVFGVYVLNLLFLAVNWVIYARNRKLDAERRAAEAAGAAASK